MTVLDRESVNNPRLSEFFRSAINKLLAEKDAALGLAAAPRTDLRTFVAALTGLDEPHLTDYEMERPELIPIIYGAADSGAAGLTTLQLVFSLDGPDIAFTRDQGELIMTVKILPEDVAPEEVLPS